MTDWSKVKKVYKLNSLGTAAAASGGGGGGGGGSGGKKKQPVRVEEHGNREGSKDSENRREMEIVVLGSIALRGY